MMKKKFRSYLTILLLSAALVICIVLMNTNFSFVGVKSIHEDAVRYQTRHCLAFYPEGDYGKKQAKGLCRNRKDNPIYDYSLIPYGDYNLVSYGSDLKYFIDQNNQPLKIEEMNEEGKKIAADYLRYTFKKEKPELYYDPDFLKEMTYEKIDFTDVSYTLEEEKLVCSFPQYEMNVSIPLRYLQKALDMNFGYPYELYRKPVYIDPERPLICLTFDDGPYLWDEPGNSSCERIVDLLYQYDATGTFYVIGNNLENREVWSDYQVYAFLKRSINQGNEYGSHTKTHLYTLDELPTSESIYNEINEPIEYLKEFMNYDMRTYRPVEGVFDDDVLASQPVGAILWDVDSEDWYSLDPKQIIEEVLSYEYETGDIIIFHDIYDETAQSLETIIPELIKRGCQLVTVSDLLNALNIDIGTLKYYYGPNYYE